MIDNWIRRDWPPEVLRAMNLFEQGHIVRLPAFFYYATPTHWLVAPSQPEGSEFAADDVLVVDDRDSPTLGVITTQACDLSEEGRLKNKRPPRQPWIQAAPVVQARLAGKPPGFLIRLSALNTTPASFADLRIEFPIEKSWLVGQELAPGFASLEEQRNFADALAKRRSRIALPHWLSVGLQARLEDEEELQKVGLLTGVVEIRLAVSGPFLQPDAVGLLIVAETENAASRLEPLWAAWWEQLISEQSWPTSAVPVRLTTMDVLSAREYTATIPISHWA